ncbi:MAG: hypothetical protein EA383_16370 [Spirochaetaceae bacterium]|nr:MAG: hypothetical protein EA383_16370 [Spirochaetaceae bacterium]
MMMVLALVVAGSAAAQVDVSVLPQFLTPLGLTIPDAPDLYRPGGGIRVSGMYVPAQARWLRAGGELGFDYVDTENTDAALFMMSAHATGGVSFTLGETFALQPIVSAGYAYSLWDGRSAGQFSAAADLQLAWRITPQLSVVAGGGYTTRVGLYEGARAFLGTTFALGTGAREPLTPTQIRIDPVFPILYQYYDHGPFGAIEIENTGADTLRDVRLSFFVNEYMDSPRTFARFDRIARGERVEADVVALFNNRILSVTEGERVSAQVTVDYTAMGRPASQTIRETVQIHNRNALTWDDDRKAAAFVTARDPNILRYARNTVGVVEESPLRAINTNFTVAMALFESFGTFGITYVVDPQSPYEQLSQDAFALDFIQFPSQTLEYRAGDCDDLAILYNALLESVGVETAFITTPGHIYAAFNLDMWPEDAERTFGSLDNLIVYDDAVWLPVEITAIRQGFVTAWELGARQWREASATGDGEIHLTHQAWQVYPPVASPGDGLMLATLPDRDRLLATYSSRLDTFITRSIYSREQQLLGRIRSDRDTRPINALGVLYARHGLYDRAAEQFRRIASRSASAQVNLGNIAYLRDEYPRALEHFRAALSMEPANTTALLGTAMAQHQLHQHGAAAASYAQLTEQDAELAGRYAWLGTGGGGDAGTTRASSADDRTRMVWDE